MCYDRRLPRVSAHVSKACSAVVDQLQLSSMTLSLKLMPLPTTIPELPSGFSAVELASKLSSNLIRGPESII